MNRPDTENTDGNTAGTPASPVAKEKDTPIDDGRTVSPMTAEWMPWNTGRTMPGRAKSTEKGGEERSDRRGETLTKEEKRAMLRGAFMAHLPVIGGLALVAAVLFGLACLWLMPG